MAPLPGVVSSSWAPLLETTGPEQLVTLTSTQFNATRLRMERLIDGGAPPVRLRQQLTLNVVNQSFLDEVDFFAARDEQIKRLSSPDHQFAMPPLRPVGRSFLTTEPAQAAAVFLAAFGDAEVVPQNLSSTSLIRPSCANVTTIRRRTGETFTFVQDGRKPNPAPAYPTDVLMRRAQSSLRKVATRRALWSQYEDNHDGYGLADGTDIPAVVNALGGGATWYWSNETILTQYKLMHGVFRFWIPGSLWTSEFGMVGSAERFGSRSNAAIDTLLSVQTENPDTCRKPGLDYMYTQRNVMNFFEPWFKATFASATPADAQRFAVDYLGAEYITSPYEEPVEGCHYARWAIFANRTQASWENPESDGRNFMLHFVLSEHRPFDTPTPTTRLFGEAVAAGRRLSDNVFDRYMYDALVLWVADLKPFLDRLDAGSVPYLIRGWPENGVAGVFVAIPGAEAVIELRSDRGVAPERIEPYDVCSDS